MKKTVDNIIKECIYTQQGRLLLIRELDIVHGWYCSPII